MGCDSQVLERWLSPPQSGPSLYNECMNFGRPFGNCERDEVVTDQLGTERFSVGSSVLYRGLDEHRRVVSVLPVRVVQDDQELVVLWLPLGTPTMKPELIDHTPGMPRRWVDGNWVLVQATWRWAELLIIVRPGERRATWVRWAEDRTFQGWAVNMQSELNRSMTIRSTHDDN